MTSEITQINRAEALRYMGYTHEPDERISAVIDQCEQELLKEARPQFVWRVFNIQRSGREIFLSDCDFELEGHDIAEHLRGCDKAAVVCSTLSSSADRFLKKLDVSDSMKALITDALANAMVEQVNEEARQDTTCPGTLRHGATAQATAISQLSALRCSSLPWTR